MSEIPHLDAFEQRGPSQDDSATAIDQRRMSPPTCLYCTKTTLTKEHAVPEAIGGRLWASILCANHNSLLSKADSRLSTAFAPYVSMLQVPRHRGTVGAEFRGEDHDGRQVLVVPAGYAREEPLHVIRRDDKGRIVHAVGSLERLDALPKGALSPHGTGLVLATISTPTVRFEVAADRAITGPILKSALHFVVGFAVGIDTAEAEEMLPNILDADRGTRGLLRSPFLRPDVFPDSYWPRHELTAYRESDDYVMVTVLLFGALPYYCRLRAAFPFTGGIRYTQYLDERFPRFMLGLERPAGLDWSDVPGSGDAEVYSDPIKARIRRVHMRGAEFSLHARSRRAFEAALNESANFGSLWERYRAALQLECFSATEVTLLVKIGQHLSDEGEAPWRVSVRIEPGGEDAQSCGLLAKTR